MAQLLVLVVFTGASAILSLGIALVLGCAFARNNNRRRMLARALVAGNLLMNAIQHSLPGSVISVSTRHGSADEVVLSVEDAGGGIPEADLSKVFQAGWRGTTAGTPEQVWDGSPGAGLGLAIVHATKPPPEATARHPSN